MLEACIKSLLVPEYDGYKIYAHNLANFDSIFLMKILVRQGEVKPIINKGRLISIKFKSGSISLQFMDSYQILLASLKRLTIAFECKVQKDIFPFYFLNDLPETIDSLNYIGYVPLKKYFPEDLSDSNYLDYLSEFKNKTWSLKEEAIKYCVNDCVSLHQVLIKFSKIIWDMYKVNITKFPTISSLSFAIFRTHFLKKDTIPMISGQVFKDIKESYTGGATDMYLPTNIESSISEVNQLDDLPITSDELLYCYDVNSLYPFIMKSMALPIGKIFYFEGNILNIKSDAIGFFYVKVTAPDSLDHPIIQIHVNNTTMSPLGTWEMMIYSEEMHNAIKYGYKFEILRGYYFDGKEVIFKNYITELYNLRLDYDKSHPMNFIAKILMNSLYGRFGMDDNYSTTKIYDKVKFEKMISKLSPIKLKLIEEIGNIGNNHMFVNSFSDQTNTMLDNSNQNHNINVAIASSITALARVEMSKYKNNPHLKLYYTDTDSIFINLNPQQLNLILPDIVGNNIGQLKLEYIINKAIFLDLANNFTPIIKIKGLNKNAISLTMENELTFNKFYGLLNLTNRVIKE